MVEAFLAQGAIVSYCSRSTTGDDYDNFKGAAEGARAIGTPVDISDHATLKKWVETAHHTVGRIDVVVANGMNTRVWTFLLPLLIPISLAASPHKSATIEDWNKAFQADILGLITLIETSVPYLTESDGPKSIVVISSLAGFEARHSTLTGPYSTVKRTQAMLARSYARTVAPQGIRVNSILPGAVESPSVARTDGREEPSAFQLLKKHKPEFLEQLLAQIPFGRVGIAEEVANAVIFLASQLSSYTTGATLHIDGAMATTF